LSRCGGRNALMIAARHVWGTITGLLVSYLSEEVGE